MQKLFSGCLATRQLIWSQFVCLHLAHQLTAWACDCLAWQCSKVSRHILLPLAALPVPEHRFPHLQVDLSGDLPVSSGNTRRRPL
jgi:hypothetical protein